MMKAATTLSAGAKTVRARFGSVAELARQAGVSRCHLSEALANKPGRGGVVRVKVAKLLTDEELKALGWSEAGKEDGRSEPQIAQIPQI